MTISTKQELIDFIGMSQSIEHIEKVMKATYDTNLVIFENDSLNDVKNKVIDWIETYGENQEIPLFVSSMTKNFNSLM